MQDHAADHLLIVMAQSDHTPCGFANDSEGFRKERIKRFAVTDTLAEFVGHRAQASVIKRLEARFKRVDLNYRLVQRAQDALVTASKNTRQDTLKHRSGISG